MKTKLLTFGLIFASVIAVAQTPRLSLYEEFTGENCGPCASTNPALNVKLAAPSATPLVVSIKWQVPIPSAPPNAWSLYKTNIAEIDWRYRSTSSGYGYPSQSTPTSAITSGINSAPSGRLDGQHQWAFGAASDHPFYMSQNVIATAQSYTSAFSIVLKREWAQSDSQSFNVLVHITATAPFTSVGNLVFRTVMIEKLVKFKNAIGTAVAPGTNGEKVFESPAVKSYPSIQNGVSLQGSWAVGQTKTFTLNCKVPAYMYDTIRFQSDGITPNANYNRNRQLSELDFVGFIQDDGNRKVAQAVRGSDCEVETVTVSSPVVCEGELVTLTASNNSGGSNFLWSNGQTGAAISVVATANPFTWNYNAASTDSLACPNVGKVGFIVDACTGIKKSNFSGVDVNIFPNPSKGEFLVKTGIAVDKATIVIYNNLGQQVYQQTLNLVETSVKTNLPKGVYLYDVLTASKKLSSGKLIVE